MTSDPASCAAHEESQGTWLFSGIETFPAVLRSFGSLTRGWLRMTRTASFCCGKTQRTEIKMLDDRSTMCYREYA